VKRDEVWTFAGGRD